MEEKLIQLGFTLAEVVSRNTISFVGTKMEAAKQKKTLEEQSLAYTEIINNLLADKEELTTIAREYKQELDNVIISDEDIEYLHNTLEQFIILLNSFAPQTDGTNEMITNLIRLLNKDTLKTMQLLGFNYKEAIGIPLTEVCSSFILSSLTKKNKSTIYKKNK